MDEEEKKKVYQVFGTAWDITKKREQKMKLINDIKLYRNAINNLPVFSENWCYAVNKFEYVMYELEELTREGVTLFD